MTFCLRCCVVLLLINNLMINLTYYVSHILVCLFDDAQHSNALALLGRRHSGKKLKLNDLKRNADYILLKMKYSSLPASRTSMMSMAPSAGAISLRPPPVPVPRVSPGPRPMPRSGQSYHGPRAGAGGPASQPRFCRPGDARVHSRAGSEANLSMSPRIPICARCTITIRGPFVVALDRTWCPEHFTCDKCGRNMVDMGFIETTNGQVVCEDDYARFMAPRCSRCNQSIVGTIVTAMEQTWHTECFTCTQCHKPIAGNLFHVDGGKPYCEADFAKMFQIQCHGCQFPIEPGDQCVEAGGQQYHITCFNCTVSLFN